MRDDALIAILFIAVIIFMLWKGEELTNDLKPPPLAGPQSDPAPESRLSFIPIGRDVIIAGDGGPPTIIHEHENVFITPDWVLAIKPARIDPTLKMYADMRRQYPWAFVDVH